jgi:hypothetical protein
VKSTVSQWRLSEDEQALMTPAGLGSCDLTLYVSTWAGLEVVKGRLENQVSCRETRKFCWTRAAEVGSDSAT